MWRIPLIVPQLKGPSLRLMFPLAKGIALKVVSLAVTLGGPNTGLRSWAIALRPRPQVLLRPGARLACVSVIHTAIAGQILSMYLAAADPETMGVGLLEGKWKRLARCSHVQLRRCVREKFKSCLDCVA